VKKTVKSKYDRSNAIRNPTIASKPFAIRTVAANTEVYGFPSASRKDMSK
jgi:hypothetical protein